LDTRVLDALHAPTLASERHSISRDLDLDHGSGQTFRLSEQPDVSDLGSSLTLLALSQTLYAPCQLTQYCTGAASLVVALPVRLERASLALALASAVQMSGIRISASVSDSKFPSIRLMRARRRRHLNFASERLCSPDILTTAGPQSLTAHQRCLLTRSILMSTLNTDEKVNEAAVSHSVRLITDLPP
jgi:hypothetical protein